jgi:hypothetical protein
MVGRRNNLKLYKLTTNIRCGGTLVPDFLGLPPRDRRYRAGNPTRRRRTEHLLRAAKLVALRRRFCGCVRNVVRPYLSAGVPFWS